MKNEENIITLENIHTNYAGNIHTNYEPFRVLENINLKINANENWAVLGANGSGKTSLMRLFLNDLYPDPNYECKSLRFGKDKWDIFELKKKFGIVTNDIHNQFMVCAGCSTAYEVVLSGYHSSTGVFKHLEFTDEECKYAIEIMKFLDIYDIRDKIVSQISTGQLRRCIIGRALVHNPKVFILDEPTVGLDIKAQDSFIKLIRKLSVDYPIILVTHQVEEIFPEITHIALMKNKTIYKQGKKEDILTSENLSDIFGINIDLQKYNDRYYIKNLG